MRRSFRRILSYARVGPRFELRRVANADPRALEGDRAVALELLQRPLHDFAYRSDHRGDLLVRDARTGRRRVLDDVLMVAEAAEKKPRHPRGDIAQGEVLDNAAERALATGEA